MTRRGEARAVLQRDARLSALVLQLDVRFSVRSMRPLARGACAALCVSLVPVACAADARVCERVVVSRGVPRDRSSERASRLQIVQSTPDQHNARGKTGDKSQVKHADVGSLCR